eukprot:scaffold1200_cov236-Isochrysis_galbana.AAC.6
MAWGTPAYGVERLRRCSRTTAPTPGTCGCPLKKLTTRCWPVLAHDSSARCSTERKSFVRVDRGSWYSTTTPKTLPEL